MIQGALFAAFLAFCRIGACFMVMPGFSSARVPMRIRLFVAVAASLALLVNLWDQIIPFVRTQPSSMVFLIASELLVGLLIGLVTRFYVLALQFIGSAIAMASGFTGPAGPPIEEDEAQSPIAAIISFGALMVLFALDFHHQIIAALVESYRLAPIDALFNPQGALVDLTDTLSQAFLVMLRLGSPFIAYAILINLATGLVNKLAPQIPVYFISMPFVLAGALVLAYFGIGTMLSLFGDSFAPVTLGR